MRNTLLTTTALVLSAGIASADGHATINWSGTATAGIARQGATALVKKGLQTASSKLAEAAAIADTDDTIDGTDTSASPGTSTNSITNSLLYQAQVLDDAAIIGTNIAATTAGTTAATIEANLILVRAEIKLDRAAQVLIQDQHVTLANRTAATVYIAKLDKAALLLNETFGAVSVAKVKAGDFETYSEVNATVTGSVTAGEMTFTAAMSVDAGKGYTFASDKTFDTAAAGRVALDNVTIAGPMGSFKIDENAVAHLVDGDDDDTADVLYTNTFGTVSFSAAIDVSKDTDLAAAKAINTVGWTAGVDSARGISDTTGVSTMTSTAAVAADVAWSAKVSMPIGAGSAYVAMDEEGGNLFGASATLGGVGLTFSSKLEALEEELSLDRVNDLGLTYVVGGTTLGATWNSVEDKDQWGISAAYAGDGITMKASTDEGSDWAVSGSYLIGTDAKVVGGVNYTEDAYLGLSFSF